MASELSLTFGRFRLDPASGQLFGDSRPIPLAPKALSLLEYLAERPGRLVKKSELLDAVWPGVFVADGALKVCIREIRRALGDDAQSPRFIETAHRRGYRFIADVARAAAVSVPAASAPPSVPGTLAVTPGPVQYARSGDVNIAYQLCGSGPVDLVFVMGWVSHLEYFWKEPSFARFLGRLASFSRLILFDKRGTGLSDPVTRLPTLEQRMDDVRAVLEAAGSRRAVLLGVSEGGPMCSLFAATHPAQTEALVMIGTYARRLRAPDYPWAPTRERREQFLREIIENWGGPVGINERAPSVAGDPAFREWWASFLRMGASPAAAVALTRMNADIDVRHVLPTIRVPTLVLHRAGDRCLLVEEGRYVANLIPNSHFVELAGDDHLPFVGDQDALLDEIEKFLVRARTHIVDSDRALVTILCADAGVASRAIDLRAAAASLDRLRDLVATQASRFGGGAVRVEEGRVFVVFDGPARAIRCGCAISAEARASKQNVRLGLHTGECDMVAGIPHGVVVDIGMRIARLAKSGEVLVTRTVVDLVAGSGLEFRSRGIHALATIHKTWQLYAVRAGESTGAPSHVRRRAARTARHA
ncbi:MAG TPA: alpha/beta fold hydrolase [Vicinamibacterales bacterium]|nr:alpha/beta fold hydrolase [Vicinamibacterales bacterium]